MFNPLSRREVLRFGAYTTVGGVLTPGISMAQAIVTDSKGLFARDVTLTVGGVAIPAYEARPEAAGRYPVVVAISGFTGNSEHHKDVVRRLATTRRRRRRTPGSGSSRSSASTFGPDRALPPACAPEVLGDLRSADISPPRTIAHCHSWQCVRTNCQFFRLIVG